MAYRSVNPYSGKELRVCDELTDGQLEQAIQAAERCYQTWGSQSLSERAAVLRKSAAILRDRACVDRSAVRNRVCRSFRQRRCAARRLHQPFH